MINEAEKISALVETLTREEKVSLLVGKNFWQTMDYYELEVRPLFMSDGPHGLRKQDVDKSDHMGLNESREAICFPTGSAVACSWNRALLWKMGNALGEEASDENVDILLGPAVNIKRSPLCGRNFEYYSEDPYLTGELAAAFIDGVQNTNTAACIKHFAANNQETRRKSVNAIIDERALREIYLKGFEIAIKKSNPKVLMTSYNKVNGDYPAQNEHLLAEILRGEWGYDGVVVSDWGGMDDIIASVNNGFDLQMPGDGGYSAGKLLKALENGKLKGEKLDSAVRRILMLQNACRKKNKSIMTKRERHKLAEEIAKESMVLLKNASNLLPLNTYSKIAVIGEMAVRPRFQGGGSSHVNCWKLDTGLEALRNIDKDIAYAQGYRLDAEETDNELLDEAILLASKSDTVVIFAGLPDRYETEAVDRSDINMPLNQVELIEKIAAVNTNVAVVLSTGSVISMPWKKLVKSILLGHLAGEAGGNAVAALLFGFSNPCGKLAETYCEKLEHNPSYLNYPGHGDVVEYREGIYVGYRYYDKKNIEPGFCFGHGLSYTNFQYTNLQVSETGEGVQISVKVKNVGNYAGKETIQVYVGRTVKTAGFPDKELKDFEKIYLNCEEEKTIQFWLEKPTFYYFNTDFNKWHMDTGEYVIYIGSSSKDIRLTANLWLEGEKESMCFTRNSLFADVFTDEKNIEIMKTVFEQIKDHLPYKLGEQSLQDVASQAIFMNMTFNSLQSYVGGYFSDELIADLLLQLNK